MPSSPHWVPTMTVAPMAHHPFESNADRSTLAAGACSPYPVKAGFACCGVAVADSTSGTMAATVVVGDTGAAVVVGVAGATVVVVVAAG